MRKYYRHKYYRNNVLTPTKNEKIVFEIIANIIKMIVYTITNIYKMTIYIPTLSKNFYKSYKNGYNLNELVDKLNHLTPRQFEVLMAEVFKFQGYTNVILTKFTHDYGRDIILKRKVNGKIEVTYVECKYYAEHNTIGRDICFKLLGSMQMFNADKGIVCSTGKFHKNSIEVATSVDNLELMDTNDIKMMLYKLNSEQIQKVMFKLNNVA